MPASSPLTRPFAIRLLCCIAVFPALLMTGCSEKTNNSEQPSTPVESSTVATQESVSESSSPTSTSDTRSSSSSESESAASKDEELKLVREKFSSLAPDSLFEQFDGCNPSGIADSFQCSGPEIGQFQFFKSSAKAVSTTQLLTELRSSRVVEDTGQRVVGWSTLGTTAVITVVDNEHGLVMQQMISSDQEDPEKRIKELGLVSASPVSSSATATSAHKS